jgi:hypothetical protein
MVCHLKIVLEIGNFKARVGETGHVRRRVLKLGTTWPGTKSKFASSRARAGFTS